MIESSWVALYLQQVDEQKEIEKSKKRETLRNNSELGGVYDPRYDYGITLGFSKLKDDPNIMFYNRIPFDQINMGITRIRRRY